MEVVVVSIATVSDDCQVTWQAWLPNLSIMEVVQLCASVVQHAASCEAEMASHLYETAVRAVGALLYITGEQ